MAWHKIVRFLLLLKRCHRGLRWFYRPPTISCSENFFNDRRRIYLLCFTGMPGNCCGQCRCMRVLVSLLNQSETWNKLLWLPNQTELCDVLVSLLNQTEPLSDVLVSLLNQLELCWMYWCYFMIHMIYSSVTAKPDRSIVRCTGVILWYTWDILVSLLNQTEVLSDVLVSLLNQLELC